MRESIGESVTLQIVAAFILLFVAFLALMISYSKCFKTKNEVITIIEKYEGITTKSKKIISDFLINNNYKGTGNCPSGYNGYDILGNSSSSNNAAFCIKPVLVSDNTLVYYEVSLFYSFNLSGIGNIATFEVKGKTNDLNTDNYFNYYMLEDFDF